MNTYVKEAWAGNIRIISYNVLVFLMANLYILFMVSYTNIENIYTDIKSHGNHGHDFVGDMDYFCQLYDCSEVYHKGDMYIKGKKLGEYTILPNVKDPHNILFHFTEHGYITEDFEIYIKLSETINGYMIISNNIFLRITDDYMILSLLLFVLFNLILAGIGLRNYNMFRYRIDNRRDSDIYTKSLIVLAENLHHELNTPMAVISNKIDKIKKYLTMIDIDGTIEKNLGYDYELIESSIIQINDILNKMKQFKMMKKHSNSGFNKSLYDIIKITLDVMAVTQIEKFLYEIDPTLNRYKVNIKYFTDGEITGIILNMVKNSIENHANSLKITGILETNNRLAIFIADNGGGIEAKNINDIFKDNFSSKTGDRKSGSGLYVNKFILETGEGTISVIDTSSKGTIFKITIPVKEIQ